MGDGSPDNRDTSNRSAAGASESWDFDSANSVRTDEPTNTVNQYDTVSLTGSAGASIWSLSYDGSDNLSGDGTRFFNHDTRNRLTGIAEPGQTTTYQYDVIGRRIGKSLNSGASWTGYVHAGGMEIGEVNAAGQYLVRYVPGPGIDQRETMPALGRAGQARPGGSSPTRPRARR